MELMERAQVPCPASTANLPNTSKNRCSVFKKEKKKGTVMNRIAKGYSEEEIKVIASFFGKLGN